MGKKVKGIIQVRFIEIANGDTVQVSSIDRFTRGKDGFAIVHIGIDQIRTKFSYESLKNLLAIDQIGNGPNPTATAMTY